MNRIVDIENIMETLFETYSDTTAFDVSFTLDGVQYNVLSTADFLNELETNYYEMSYLTHKAKEFDIDEFVNIWHLYILRHNDEWTHIFNTEHLGIDPLNDYHETKTYTPDISVSNSGTFGRTSSNAESNTNNINHGKNTLAQTNTYDGVLRDSAQTGESGNTTTTNRGTATARTNGTETSVSRTQGNTTETKTGYKNNPFDNAQKAVEYYSRFNLRDMIISGFTKECLFYDNGNGGGCLWHLPLI